VKESQGGFPVMSQTDEYILSAIKTRQPRAEGGTFASESRALPVHNNHVSVSVGTFLPMLYSPA